MIRPDKGAFKALLMGVVLLFPWCGIIGMADAAAGDTQGTTSVGKRQGQSPGNKRASKATSGETREHGTTSVGKRQGQSPANKRASKAAPKEEENSAASEDRRQGQSPGNE